MSVPANRVPARPSGATPPSNKWFGMPKWLVIVIAILGIILAYYIYKKQSASAASTSAGTDNSTLGDLTPDQVAQLESALGGTPEGNSFWSGVGSNDQAVLNQLQQLQQSINELENQGNGGNGAGLPVKSPSPGGITGTIGTGTAVPLGSNSTTQTPTGSPGTIQAYTNPKTGVIVQRPPGAITLGGGITGRGTQGGI